MLSVALPATCQLWQILLGNFTALAMSSLAEFQADRCQFARRESDVPPELLRKLAKSNSPPLPVPRLAAFVPLVEKKNTVDPQPAAGTALWSEALPPVELPCGVVGFHVEGVVFRVLGEHEA